MTEWRHTRELWAKSREHYCETPRDLRGRTADLELTVKEKDVLRTLPLTTVFSAPFRTTAEQLTSPTPPKLSPYTLTLLTPPKFLPLVRMFGAGRRKIRPPARFVSSPAEDAELEWHSTPAELSKRLEDELLDVTRQLEKMKADLGVGLERAGRVRTPLPTTTPEDADGGQRSPIPEIPARVKDGRPEVHARALRAELREPNPPVRQNFPTLREVRAFQQLQSDPTEFSRHIPRYTEAEQWGAASIEGHPPPPKYNTQQVQEGLPPSQQGDAWTLLEQDTLRTQQQAFAASTRANHQTQFRAYIAFCKFFGKVPIPASAHLLSCYAQFLSRSLKSPDTIAHYLSAVKLLHQLHGHYQFSLQQFELQQTLRGLKKILRHRPKGHHSITPEFLLKAREFLNLNTAKDVTTWTVLLIGFFAYLRRSNLVPTTAKAFDNTKHLQRRDILCVKEGLLIQNTWSKTIQANERDLVVPILAIPGSPLCPVVAYNNMLQLCPAPPDAPAFLLPPTARRRYRPMTASTLTKELARLVKHVGLPKGYHTLHDLRRGGYTLAFEAGVPRELRKQHGDWRSDADLLYLRPSVEQRLRVPAAMRHLILQRM
ncbi:uncharacterized protein LOC118409209 [Branchiostoma floridae]|uniref:Uncharacterized protein LOC118409209 n=1 Tax=Branchiostoma floridae TaxID=7739 RepID=A0A9J7KJ81_BRAFL|nr:uncharacterized protein LOC118409209 [Branchiostoma floridae]